MQKMDGGRFCIRDAKYGICIGGHKMKMEVRMEIVETPGKDDGRGSCRVSDQGVVARRDLIEKPTNQFMSITKMDKKSQVR